MSRVKLADRRAAITRKIVASMDGGKEVDILITVGFDENQKAKEVFCAAFKSGTALHGMVMDFCVMLSRLLQHGDSPRELAASCCEGPSLVGQIAQAVAEMEDANA